MEANESVAQAQKLLLGLLSANSRDTFSQRQLLQSLEKEKDLVHLIFTEMIQFKLVPPPDLGRYTYVENITTRFRMLCELLTAPGIILEYDHISVLWDVYFKTALLQDERDLCFDLLSVLCPLYNTSSGPKLTIATVSKIMENLLLPIPNDTLSRNGFHCFSSYFVRINMSAQKIERVRQDLVALSSDFLHLAKIWGIVLENNDPEVIEEATTLLNELHTNLSPHLDFTRTYEQHVGFLMGELRKLMQAPARPDTAGRLNRCTKVLSSYIKTASVKGPAPVGQPHPAPVVAAQSQREEMEMRSYPLGTHRAAVRSDGQLTPAQMEQVQQLVSVFGADEQKAIRALRKTNFQPDAAAEHLLMGLDLDSDTDYDVISFCFCFCFC